MVKQTLASVCVLALLVTGCSKDNDNPQPAPAQETAAQTSPTPAAAESTTTDDVTDKIVENFEMALGEETDLDQRHFQRNFFDDSKLAPGGYGTGVVGRPLYMPVNPNGDKRGDFESPEELDCTMPDEIVGQQQYIHGRQMLITDHYGPGNFETPLPTGYPKTAAGAAVAAANLYSGAWPFDDELSIDYLRKFADSKESDAVVQQGVLSAFPAPLPQTSAGGLKIMSCGGGIVVVEVAIPYLPPNGFGVLRMPMVWRDGNWVAVLSETDEDQLYQDGISSLAGFTKVNLK